MEKRFTAADLRFAAQYIQDRGWQRDIGEPGGPRCALGALYSAIEARGESSSDWWWNVIAKPGTLFQRECGERFGVALTVWNDAQGRTKEQVIAALDEWAFDEDLKAAAMQASELNNVEPSPSLLKEAVPCG